jgi:hypothetical protein
MHQAIVAHLGTRQVARVIYGAIIGLALVVVLEQHPPAPGVAELYSEVVGTETRTRHRVSRMHLAAIGSDATAVAFGIAFPAVFFLLSGLGAMDVETAFKLAKWSGLGLIGFYGFAAARLAGAGLPTCLLQAVGAALIGALLIAMKALLH